MSHSKIISIQSRRLALLAGSATVMSAALLLTPGEALAQCAPAAPAAGQGADTIECPSSTTAYGSTGTNGIVFTSVGPLTVNVTGSAATNLGSGGVRLTAGDADDTLNFNRTGGAISGNGNTAQAIIDLQSQNGAIGVGSAGVISGNAANVLYAVRARASGTGDIHIANTSSSTISFSTGTGATNPGIAGILAQSNGGDILIESTGGGRLDASGGQYAVQASTTGDGSLHFIGNGNYSASATRGIASLDFATATGDMVLDLTSNSTGVTNSNRTNSIGIRISTNGGDAIINRLGIASISAGGSASGGAVNTNTTAIDVTMNGGTTTINNIAATGGIGQSNPNLHSDGLLRAHGEGAIVFNNTDGGAYGLFNLSDFEGSFTLDNQEDSGGWRSRGLNQFSQGNDTINNGAAGVIALGHGTGTDTLAFNAGTNTINNARLFIVGMNNSNDGTVAERTLEIEDLTIFNNSGIIALGMLRDDFDDGLRFSDSSPDDVLVMLDGHFHGLEGSHLLIDAFNATGQTSCERDTALANDCVDFRGSEVSSRTEVIMTDVLTQDRGAYNPDGNVVVDVRGGVVDSPDAFVVSPDTPGYIAVGNGGVDKGLFAYVMGFDAEDVGDGGQFKLYGIEASTSQQFPLLAQVTGEVWRAGATAWTDRRAEQRDGDPELTRRAWLRFSTGSADRTSLYTVMAGDTALDFDNNHTIETTSVTVGYDLGRVSVGGGEWVVGAMFGYGRAEISYDAIDNTGNVEGIHAGLYSGFTAGAFFQDLVVDALSVGLENDAPALGLVAGSACNPNPSPFFPPCIDDPNSRPILDTEVRGLGVNADTGWRFMLADRLSLEPMVSLQWLHTELDEMNVPADDPTRLGGKVSFDNVRSLRAGFGLRLGLDDIMPSVLPVSLRLTARSMQEWDGESAVRIVNVGPDAAVITNTFDGTFNEVSAAVSFGEGSDHVSGFLNLGGVWSGDYEAQTASAGVRLRW